MSRSQWWEGPVKAAPDFEQLLKVLRREVPDRPTLFEFFLNQPLHARLAADTTGLEPGSPEETVVAFRNAGYDYATILASDFHFPGGEHSQAKTISLNDGSVIRDRATFEAYQWPDPAMADFTSLDRAAAVLPAGMKAVCQGPCGVLENVISLVGFDNLCFMLADDPELTAEIFDAVGRRIVAYYRTLVQYEAVGAIIGNDDWGFKTQPMISPDDMRRYVIPWHKRIVELAHDAGKPAIMHCCGNLAELMDDIIDDIRYDGKHSYEDAIQPVEEAYDTYGSRIAILGGLDVDFVIRSTPEAVYRRAKEMLERAADRGSYALGTGNSVPEYVPDEQYFAMIAAATEGR
ncbi:MAG: uroporphyrinogen decarboxylase family protein [Kiritimatiellia bacterium]|nr:uroporphyrinogen decarboxylase family protein [Kiritimatiellia bacterium]